MSDWTDQISKCKAELANLGYHNFQIDSIIKDTVGTLHVDRIDQGQYTQLLDTLREYINFAFKCRKLTNCTPIQQEIK
jgi:hypothetical protein